MTVREITDPAGNVVAHLDLDTGVLTPVAGVKLGGGEAAPAADEAPKHSVAWKVGMLASHTFEDPYQGGKEVTKVGIVVGVDEAGNPSIGWLEGPSGSMGPDGLEQVTA